MPELEAAPEGPIVQPAAAEFCPALPFCASLAAGVGPEVAVLPAVPDVSLVPAPLPLE
jgi:hypothetical protein